MGEETFTPLEKLLTQGKELGYEGEELRKFVESQQKAERDERAERRRVEHQQLEMEKLRLTAEAGGRPQECRDRLRAAEAWTGERGTMQANGDADSTEAGRRRHGNAPRPKLPKFQEEGDSIDTYIDRFEAFAENQGWQEGEWALMLSALLRGKALHVFSTLSKADQRDYKKLREALMKGYDLTEEGFRRKFRQARIQSGETYAQFGVRLDHYFNKWLELSDVGKDFVKLKSLLIREQILSGCGAELTVHLKERKPQTTEELLEAAEVCREARSDVKPPRSGLGQQIKTFKSERCRQSEWCEGTFARGWKRETSKSRR